MSRSEPRLFIPPAQRLHTGAEIALDPAQAHYLGAVMRQQAGAGLTLFNGRDGEWHATLADMRKKGATAQVETCLRPQPPQGAAPGVPEGPELLFSPLKRDATETVIRMGTELGVSRFRPVVCARTNTHRLNLERLALIAIEASEQCERLTVPPIMPLEPLTVVLARWPRRRTLAVALEREGGSPALVAADALLIGPEGGFAPEERARMMAMDFVRPLSLGALVLRADTAVASGLARLEAAQANQVTSGQSDCQPAVLG
ncbi:16S rRNA (uracil(1498)-N(3))-methyltransferase [Formicincola oecophyllae]|uniref:Ribosomal RNA small subunit methyltransferase E n=1 Tax=Formicincola oecophyllae TaxID=2558361 RepID=A0A4Y6U6E0_9PROT|nr:RsmE family RNA methyltransferase [Formicincola oecophyllae]QDH12913.1 16S rRNA (uracil(1498)-N(3))-methyltransferase [Formicincola oecophyllae]